MNTFNRVVIALILLAVIGVSAIVILLLLFPRSPLSDLLINVGTMLKSETRQADLLRTELIILLLIVFVPSVVLLLLELRRPSEDSIRIASTETAALSPEAQAATRGLRRWLRRRPVSEARLSKQAVASGLVYYIDALPGVIRVRPRLNTNGITVDVRLDVETAPDVDVRAKTDDITRTARTVMQDRLGVKLGQLSVQIYHAAYPRGAARSERAGEPRQAAMPALSQAKAESAGRLENKAKE